MKRMLFGLVLLSASVVTAEDPSLLFVSDFDAYSVKAQFGKGGVTPSGFNDESLQLRMWPGAYGNINSLAYSKSETCKYPLKDNFDPRQGTVSFWVSSLGWKPSSKAFQWFFSAKQPGFNLHVYKFTWSGHLYFYIDHLGKDGQFERLSCGAIIEDKDWTEGKWHKLDAVWNETGMKLYVDGILPKVNSKSAWLKSTRVFPEAIKFPEADAKGELVINASPVKEGAEKDERTAIDDIRVYSRPLSDKEVYDAYTSVVPSKFGSVREELALSMPKAVNEVKVDGKIEAAEWEDAAQVPLSNIPGFSKDPATTLRGTAQIKYDKDNLFIALKANRPSKHCRITEHDGALWNDDSFEVMFTRDDKEVYHLIANIKGTLYDEKNGNKLWDSQAKIGASNASDGWQMEMAIPLKSIGGLPKRGNIGITSYRSGTEGDIEAVTWSEPGWSFGSVEGFGKWMATEKPVSILRTGNVDDGEIALEVKGEAAFQAFVEWENGDKATCGCALGKEAWNFTPRPGKQRIVVSAKLENGVEPLKWERFFYVNKDIEVTYNCHTYDRYIEATATLSGKVARQIAEQGKLEGAFQVVRKDDGKVIAEAKAVATGPTVTGNIPAKDIEAGKYEVVAKFGEDSAGKRFWMPDLTALDEHVGMDHSVPEPWHEVRKAGESTWEVLDRTYTFGKGPFPESIVSRGSELFVKSPEMRFDGRKVEWSQFRVTETQPDYVKFAGRGKLGTYEFGWKSELWFDGFYLVTLGMRGEGDLSEVVLDYTLPREFMRYVYKQDYRNALYFWKNDRIEKVFNPLLHQENSMHWTSGIEKGFVFGCISDANWANKPEEPNIIYTRDATTATLTAKIISRAVKVAKPLKWQFVMQGTPSRRPRKDWRADNTGGYRVPTMQNLQFGGYGEAAFIDRRSPDRWTTPSNYKFKWPEWFLESQAKAKERLASGEKPEWQTKSHMPCFHLPYCMPMHVGTNEPEYDWFYHDAAKRPAITWSYMDDGVKQTEYCVCDTRVYDIYMKNMEWFLKNSVPSTGIYNDCCHMMNCDNERHGHGGIDAFGKKFSSVCWLSQRNYHLRGYRLIKKYGRILKNHTPASDLQPFVMDFCDLVWPGEEFYGVLLENLDGYTEYIPVEAWQSIFNANITGVGHHMLTQYDRASSAMNEETRKKCDFKNNPEWAERILTAALPHDVAVSAAYVSYKTIDKWWIIKENLKLWDATFHGYWYDDTIKTTTDKMYVSWYELPKTAEYRYLVIASNFSRQDAPLGIAKLPWAHSAIREFWNEKEVTDGELPTMTVPAKKFVLLGIK